MDEFRKVPKADIQRDTYDEHPLKDASKFQLTVAGTNLAPWGYDYEGSVAMHYYKQKGTHNYVFISQQLGLGKVPEAQADVGLKELRKAMMKTYGREDNRRGDVKEEIL
jgi:hypothetical protein